MIIPPEEKAAAKVRNAERFVQMCKDAVALCTTVEEAEREADILEMAKDALAKARLDFNTNN